MDVGPPHCVTRWGGCLSVLSSSGPGTCCECRHVTSLPPSHLAMFSLLASLWCPLTLCVRVSFLKIKLIPSPFPPQRWSTQRASCGGSTQSASCWWWEWRGGRRSLWLPGEDHDSPAGWALGAPLVHVANLFPSFTHSINYCRYWSSIKSSYMSV